MIISTHQRGPAAIILYIHQICRSQGAHREHRLDTETPAGYIIITTSVKNTIHCQCATTIPHGEADLMSSHRRAWCHPHLSVSIRTGIQQSLHRIRVTIHGCEHQRCATILQYSAHSRSTIRYSEGGPGETTSGCALTTPQQQRHAYNDPT